MIKTSVLSLTTVGIATARITSNPRFLARSRATNSCFKAIEDIDAQESELSGTYGSLTSQWYDDRFVVSDESSAIVWDDDSNNELQSYRGTMAPLTILKDSELKSSVESGDYYKWGDSYETISVWGETRSFEDIKQGGIGNCYFMAGLAIAAHMGQSNVDGDDKKLIVKKVMPLDDLSSNGIYPVTYFIGGMPRRIFLDNNLVQGYVNDDSSRQVTNEYAYVGSDGSIWTQLFEKAWAKNNGNYNHIVGGDVGEAIYAMTGAPFY